MSSVTFCPREPVCAVAYSQLRFEPPMASSWQSVIDGVVYFSTFAHRTYALAAATGSLLWTWPDGEYSPVVTDGRRIYLTGRGRIYALTTAR